MDPVLKAVYFGKTDQEVLAKDPNEARQQEEPANEIQIALRSYEERDSFENAKKLMLAYERVGEHQKAKEFADECGYDLGPRFSID